MSIRAVVIIAAGAALAACGSTPPEPPPPPPEINVYQCATPAGMTSPEPQPKRPRGEYTQDDVALYITRLHQWGMQGWLKLASVREHADKCVASTEDDDEND